jgi:hypothetical protein
MKRSAGLPLAQSEFALHAAAVSPRSEGDVKQQCDACRSRRDVLAIDCLIAALGGADRICPNEDRHVARTT